MKRMVTTSKPVAVNEPRESIAIAGNPRDYAGLLWIFAASILGFSLFCGASAIALSDPTLANPIVIEPAQAVDFAFSNPNTIALMTAEAFSDLIPTRTITPTNTVTITASPTLTPSPTPSPSKTAIIVPTATSKPQNQNPPPPPPTNKPNPTNTAIVIQTQASTPTVVQPTDEPPPPPDTDTPEPPPPTPVP